MKESPMECEAKGPPKRPKSKKGPKKQRKEIKTKTYAWAKKEIKGKVIYSRI